MKRYVFTLLALLGAVVIAACGGGHSTWQSTTTVHKVTVHTTTTTATVTTHASANTPQVKCPQGNLTMQCVLQGEPPPPRTFSLSRTQPYGIDFGWGAISASGAKALHADFAASYVCGSGGKNWTRSLIDQYHALGIKTVAVCESTANRALLSKATGEGDAVLARNQTAALGMPATRPIIFAVDCNCTGVSISAYFSGVHAILGNRGDAYGGYDQINYLYTHHLVGNENWQTYAWSGGRWLPKTVAPLEQYLNGSAFDNDRAIAPLYGQWPAATPDPRHWDWLPSAKRTFRVRAGTTKKCVFKPTASDCVQVKTRARSAVRNWDKHNCKIPVKRKECKRWHRNIQLQDARVNRIAHATSNLKHKAKKSRWNAHYYKAGDGHVTTLGGVNQEYRRRLSSKNHGIVKAWH